MRLVLIKIFFLCACFSKIELTAQSIDPSFMKEESEVQIFKGGKDKVKKRFNRSSNEDVVVSFNEGFSDSLYFYVDGSLYLGGVVKSDSLGRGYTCASAKIDFKKLKNKRPNLVIVLPQSKVYTAFKIDKKYALIKIHHLGSTWYVIRTNYVPEYQ